MNVVIDTNVLVSALLSPFGAPARVLDLVLAGSARMAYDDRLLAEYQAVLRRAKFGFEVQAIDDLFSYITTTGLGIAAPVLPIQLPDPDDNMLLEVAAGVHAPLITGNQKHFPADQQAGVWVIAPAEFIQWWREQQK